MNVELLLLSIWLLFFDPVSFQARLFPNTTGLTRRQLELPFRQEQGYVLEKILSKAYTLLVVVILAEFKQASSAKRNIQQALLIIGFLILGISYSAFDENVRFETVHASAGRLSSTLPFLELSMRAFFLILGFMIWHDLKLINRSRAF